MDNTLDNNDSQENQNNKQTLCKELINVIFIDNPEIDVTRLYDLCQDNITYITSITNKSNKTSTPTTSTTSIISNKKN